MGLRGRRRRSVEQRLQRKLACVTDDPDRPWLGDLPFQAVAFSAIFTGDGDSHRICRVAPRVLRTRPPTVATRIPPGNESPTSAPRCQEGISREAMSSAANRLRRRLRRYQLATGEFSAPSPAAELAEDMASLLIRPRPRARPSATLGVIAFGTGARARQSHHRDRSAGPPAPFPPGQNTRRPAASCRRSTRGREAKEKFDRDPGP
jgi:hypothetical protein